MDATRGAVGIAEDTVLNAAAAVSLDSWQDLPPAERWAWLDHWITLARDALETGRPT